jgi:hypothetical protein
MAKIRRRQFIQGAAALGAAAATGLPTPAAAEARGDAVLRGAVRCPAQPGESFRYTFHRRGEYFFNDPFAGRPTGKVEVY